MSEEPEREERPLLPRWIPVLIAVVLLGMAVLAVYTGLTYRGGKVRGIDAVFPTTTRTVPQEGAPGEPQPGASRVIHGEGGEQIPSPSPIDVTRRSRVRVTTEQGRIVPSVHVSARRGMMTQVRPPDAVVYVNNQPVGTAREFSTPDEIWEFPQAGNFVVRLSAPGYDEAEFIVTATPEADREVARIAVNLPPVRP